MWFWGKSKYFQTDFKLFWKGLKIEKNTKKKKKSNPSSARPEAAAQFPPPFPLALSLPAPQLASAQQPSHAPHFPSLLLHWPDGPARQSLPLPFLSLPLWARTSATSFPFLPSSLDAHDRGSIEGVRVLVLVSTGFVALETHRVAYKNHGRHPWLGSASTSTYRSSLVTLERLDLAKEPEIAAAVGFIFPALKNQNWIVAEPCVVPAKLQSPPLCSLPAVTEAQSPPNLSRPPSSAKSRGQLIPSPPRLRFQPGVSSPCFPLATRAFVSSNRALNRQNR